MLYNNETVADAAPDRLAAAQEFCEGYKRFLDRGKTERSFARQGVVYLITMLACSAFFGRAGNAPDHRL